MYNGNLTILTLYFSDNSSYNTELIKYLSEFNKILSVDILIISTDNEKSFYKLINNNVFIKYNIKYIKIDIRWKLSEHNYLNGTNIITRAKYAFIKMMGSNDFIRINQLLLNGTFRDFITKSHGNTTITKYNILTLLELCAKMDKYLDKNDLIGLRSYFRFIYIRTSGYGYTR